TLLKNIRDFIMPILRAQLIDQGKFYSDPNTAHGSKQGHGLHAKSVGRGCFESENARANQSVGLKDQKTADQDCPRAPGVRPKHKNHLKIKSRSGERNKFVKYNFSDQSFSHSHCKKANDQGPYPKAGQQTDELQSIVLQKTKSADLKRFTNAIDAVENKDPKSTHKIQDNA